MNYIERYWRDATPADAIKEPPMVARFRDQDDKEWLIGKLFGVDRSRKYKWCGETRDAIKCQVYDAPDPGEGWRLVDPANEKWQEGDEIYVQSTGTWRKRLTPFQDWALSINRRRITPAVTYVPFTWEDRDQLRGRWIRAIDVMDTEWMITDLHIGSSGELRANSVSADELLSGFIFLDTGKPVGKEVTQ